MTMSRKWQRRPTEADPSARAGITNAIYRLTAGFETPLRLDWDRLSEAEQRDLLDLAREADTPDGLRLASLAPRKLRRLEKLAEKAAGQPGAFDQVREEAKTAAAWEEIA